MSDQAGVEPIQATDIITFLDETPSQTALLSRDGMIQALSRPLAEMLQVSPEACVGQPFTTLVVAQERAAVRALFRNLMRGAPTRLHVHLIRRSQSVDVVELALLPLDDDPEQRVVVFVCPISIVDRRERIILEFNRLVPRLLEAQSPAELYSTAAEALQPLGMGMVVAALTPGQTWLRIDYTTVSRALQDLFYRIARLDITTLKIPADAPFFGQVIERRQAVFTNSLRPALEVMLPHPTVALCQRALHLAGMSGFIFAPLLSGAQVRGALMVWSSVLNHEQVPFIEAFAHQLAALLAQIDLRAEMQRQMQRITSLATTAHAVTSLGSLDEVLRVVCTQAQELLGADLARIAAPVEGTDTLRYIMSTGQGAGYLMSLEMPVNASVSGGVLRSRQGRMIPDLRDAPEVFAPFRQHSRARSALYQPLLHQGAELGVLIVGHEQAGYFDQADLEYLGRYAEYAAVAIANAQLHGALQRSENEQGRQRRELEALFNMSQAVNHSLDLTTLLQDGLRVLEELGLARVSTVLLMDSGATSLELWAMRGVPVSVLPRIQSAALDSISAEVLREGRLRVLSPAERAQMLAQYGIGDHFREQTSVYIPLIVGEKRLGVLGVSRPETRPYADYELRLLQALANLFTHAVSKAQAHLALQDTAALNAKLYSEAEEVRSYLNALVRSTPDLLLTVQQDHIVHLLNPERLFESIGCSAEQLEGQPFLNLVPEHLHSYLLQRWQHVLSGRPQNFELELPRSNGVPTFISVSAALIADYGEVLVIIKDVTEQHEREAHLRRNEKLAALGSMVAGAGHELNNPLATILGLTQLQVAEMGPSQLRADLEEIERAALRARSIVQQLLHFARPREMHRQPVAIAPLIDETLERLRQALRASGIEVSLDVATDLPPILGDRQQLKQVLFNLINNAVQSLSLNSPDMPRTLHIRAARDRDLLQLTIEDSGPGIAPEFLARIFDPFFTTRQIGQGAGLGLAISHTIIQQHDGRIWAHSPPGKGARFIIQLPFAGA